MARQGMTVDGRYRLVRSLTNGRSGEVWLARELELGRDVVLKRVAVEGAAGFDRLWAEARALAKFSHPHVVTLYHAVRSGGRRRGALWLVMEHVPGGSLEGRPEMAPEVAARIGVQIAGALAALHAEGLVHCDIKPGNVVVTGDGTAKLADFGAAYRVGGKETITPNSAVSYTPDYAAPEVVVPGQPEPKSDVFSLGAMLYALVAGRPPRRGASRRPAATPPGSRSGMDSDPWGPHDDDQKDPSPEPSPSGGGPRGSSTDEPVAAFIAAREAARGAVSMEADVGPLTPILESMLRRDPADRPDADEARQLLEKVASPAGAIPAAAPQPDDEPEPGGLGGLVRSLPSLVGGRRRYPLPTIVLATVLVAGLAVALWAWAGRAPAPPSNPPIAEHPSGSVRPPFPSPSPEREDPIGPPRTADPCALLKPALLGRFGSTELDSDYGNFDRCDVLVQPEDDSVVDVRMDLNLDPPPEQAGKTETTGVVTVVEDPAESDECNRTLVLSGVDDTTITVTAKRDEKGRAPLCAIADVATDHAVQVLNRGTIPRRAFPAESLANQDACTLLDARALEVIPGIDAARPDRGYGGWDCEWESTTSDIWLDLRYDRGEPPDAEGGTSTRLNDYPAFIQPEGEGEETCLAQIVYRTYTDLHSQTAAETVRLLVGGSRPMQRLCAMATDLAGSAATRLPRA